MRTTLRLGCAVLLSSAALVWAQPTAQRSALVIGVGQYAPQSRAPSLEGVPYDMDSARRIAQAMGIPASQIRFMRDQEATKDNILRALGQRPPALRRHRRPEISFTSRDMARATGALRASPA